MPGHVLGSGFPQAVGSYASCLHRQAALVLSATLLLAEVASISEIHLGWTKLGEHSEESHGGGRQPAIRYNHGAVCVGDEMIISHGYFYNRETSKPEWLDDTWSFDLTGRGGWRRIATATKTAAARKSYNAGKRPPSPSGRYGVTLSHYRSKLYLFGGTDGGASKHGKMGYETGYEMAELWQFDLQTSQWAFVAPARGSAEPTARYLHTAAVIGDSMYVYGGNNDGAGDVVAWDFASRKWRLVADEAATAAEGPGPRLGHVSIPLTTSSIRGFLVYGGRKRGAETKKLAGDAWVFDVDSLRWSGPLQQVTPGGGPPPPPRVYAGMAALSSPAISEAGWGAAAVLSMGSITTPLMTCTTEAWAVLVSDNASTVGFWPLPDVPVGHYHHSLVSDGLRVHSFGGHLCSTTKAASDHPFYYLNYVESLDLSGLKLPQPSAFQEADAGSEHDEL